MTTLSPLKYQKKLRLEEWYHHCRPGGAKLGGYERPNRLWNTPMIGRTLTHYTVTAKIGEGGMGEVYRARDAMLDRDVALKVLPAAVATDPARLERFRREAKAVAALNHPNIVTIYSVEEAEDVHLIAMELVEGRSLDCSLPPDGLPLADILRIGTSLADALQAAHEAGIVHRDLKPANVMLTKQGRVKVLDFGLAKTVMPQPSNPDATLTLDAVPLTGEGTVLGTVPYMSPEQLQSKPLDARTDLFSLGVMLYELTTGTLPFAGNSVPEIMSSILREDPMSVTEFRTDVPEELWHVVRRCLAKEVEQRYQTAGQVRKDLEELQLELVEAERNTKARTTPSIAVLPLVNMSADQEQEYFCDGITEDITNGLTQIGGLCVAARTSAFAFKGKDDDMREIGKKLNVGTLLEGSVRKAGERIRVTAQLINVADGYHLWSDQYDRNLVDIFDIQDDIAKNIVQALRLQLTDKEKDAIEKAPTRNVEAYEFYLRGRELFHRGRKKTIRDAIEMFDRATRKDSCYALAYAGMADCYSWLYMFHERDRSRVEQALEASRRSLELDPELAEAHAAHGLALSLDKKYAEAEQEFEEAIHLNGMLFEAYDSYARTCRRQGKAERAAELFAKASAVNPSDYQAVAMLALSYRDMNRAAESEAANRECLKRAQAHLDLNPNDARAYYLGANALISLGKRDQALEWVERALSLDPGDSHVLYNVACVYSLAGEIDRGLYYLERSIDAGFSTKDWMETDSDLESIRLDPRYRALLKKLD